MPSVRPFIVEETNWKDSHHNHAFETTESLLCVFYCLCATAESRLGLAQAGVFGNDCVRREMVPVRDVPPGGPNPRQEG